MNFSLGSFFKAKTNNTSGTCRSFCNFFATRNTGSMTKTSRCSFTILKKDGLYSQIQKCMLMVLSLRGISDEPSDLTCTHLRCLAQCCLRIMIYETLWLMKHHPVEFLNISLTELYVTNICNVVCHHCSNCVQQLCVALLAVCISSLGLWRHQNRRSSSGCSATMKLSQVWW